MRLTLLVLLGGLLATPARAATYYVATSGADSNPCTEAAPCVSIAKGLRMLSAGDTLYLRGGDL